MPELPEVETVCRGLRPFLVGRVLTRITVRRKDLRKPIPEDLAARLTGWRVSAVERRGKYLLLKTVSAQGSEAGSTVIIHLGMSGRMVIHSQQDENYHKHDHLILTIQDEITVRFNDPRRFGLIDLAEPDQLEQFGPLKALGPEPLFPEFTPFVLATAFAGRRSPVKALLLDQGIVAGIGNIYACEALFAAGIHPMRAAQSVTPAECGLLVEALRAVLLRAIEAGGSSLRDHVQPSGELGYFQHQWAVYGQEGASCPGCQCGGGGIRRVVHGNRSSFYCPHRQS